MPLMHRGYSFERPTRPIGRLIAGLAGVCLAAGAATGAHAQGWTWPWEQQQRPAPPASVYRPPPGATPAPIPPAGGPSYGSGNRPPICLQLEQRLAQESNRGAQTRDALPKIDQEMRSIERQMQPVLRVLDSNCWDTFFFSKQLRQTRECVNANTMVEQSRRRLSELDAQRQQVQSTSGRSYQDDIIRELARNNCGANYSQEAAKRGGSGGLFGGWQDEDSGGTSGGLSSNGAPIGTYRTVCVRLCDGYYLTLPAHFDRDDDLCKSRCAAPAELYYYQNPGGTPDQMIAHRTREKITALRTAFRFRKEFVQGCSCKTAEYVPSAGVPDRRADQPVGAPGAIAQTPPWPRTTGSTPRAVLPPATPQ
jgi:Protein of unknown function (DUF2865)